MARNRKRAKERRSRRPVAGPGVRPGVATARAERERRDEIEETPGPLDHATPDAELAEAQLAVGRPELPSADETQAGDSDEERAFESSEDDGEAAGGVDGGRELAAAGPGTPARPAPSGNRLINFLQGSWRELQRVQWPDRRQVMQATGVVIGFVIVAGVYLGLVDTVAGKLVTLILK